METKDLAKIIDGFKSAIANMNTAVAKRDEELKSIGSVTSETAKRMDVLDSGIQQAIADFKGRLEGLSQKVDDIETKGAGTGSFEVPDEMKSLGSRFTSSREFKTYMASNGADRASAPVNIGSFAQKSAYSGSAERLVQKLVEKKAISGDAVLRDFFSTARLTEIFESERRRTERVRDLIPVVMTNRSIISYVRETLFDNRAATVAEGSLKPESAIGFEDAQAQASTIAHWMPVTRQLLADMPALEGLINQRLVEGLMLEEDAQLLYGSGVGADLLGLLVDPSVPSYSWSSGPYVAGDKNDTRIDAIRRAVTLAQLSRYPVDGLIMNPVDWQEIELQKDSLGQYLWARVGDLGDTRLWRMRVVVTDAINQGEAILGSFRLGCTLWDLDEATIRTTDSHADNFIYNRLVILGEERIALTTHRPQAFRRVVFDHAPVEPLS